MKIQGKDIGYLMGKALANISQVKEYKNWSNEFCRNEVEEYMKNFENALKDIDFTKFTKEELYNVGCSPYDDKLICIPIWLYNVLPDGVDLYSIFGGQYIKGKDDIDKDIRFGCMAYGFKFE